MVYVPMSELVFYMTFDDEHSTVLKVPILSAKLYGLFPKVEQATCLQLMNVFIESVKTDFLTKHGSAMKAYIANVLPKPLKKKRKTDEEPVDDAVDNTAQRDAPDVETGSRVSKSSSSNASKKPKADAAP
jgi:hypothetical protein